LGNADIARRMVIPALTRLDFFEIAGIASLSEQNKKRIEQELQIPFFSNYETLLEASLDAIYIPLPNSLHFEWIKTSLDNGIHVLAEKPMSCNLSEATEINDLARKNNLVLLENFQFRFHSQVQFIKQQIEKGVIGEIRNVRAAFGVPPFTDRNNIRYNKELGGGALLDLGVYPLKISQMFLTSNIFVDSAALAIPENENVDIWGSAFLKQNDGQVTSQIAFGFDQSYFNSLDLWGSRGQITAERIFTAGPGVKPKVTIRTKDNIEQLSLASDNHFSKILKYFYDLINEEGSRESEYMQNINQARLVDELRDKSRV